MTYSATLNKLLFDNKELSEEKKAESVKELSNEDQFALLRNIESYPYKYSKEVQNALAIAFYDKKIFLF